MRRSMSSTSTSLICDPFPVTETYTHRLQILEASIAHQWTHECPTSKETKQMRRREVHIPARRSLHGHPMLWRSTFSHQVLKNSTVRCSGTRKYREKCSWVWIRAHCSSKHLIWDPWAGVLRRGTKSRHSRMTLLGYLGDERLQRMEATLALRTLCVTAV